MSNLRWFYWARDPMSPTHEPLRDAAAWELARTLADLGVSSQSLHDWERRTRPTVDAIQRFTTLYSHVGYYWPTTALSSRAKLFEWLSVMPVTAKRWEFWWRGGTWAPHEPDSATELDRLPGL